MRRSISTSLALALLAGAAACADGGATHLLAGEPSQPLLTSDVDASAAAAADPDASSAPPAAAADAAPPAPAAADAGALAPTPVEAGACSGTVLCEDFESFALGGVPDAGSTWSVEAPSCSGTGALAIDDAQSHSGTRSLRVAGTAGYCNHVFLGTHVVAALTGAVWARFWVRLTTPLDTDHATLLAMRDDHDAHDLRMGGQDSILMWNRESDDATLPEMSPQGTALSVAPAALAWHCVELAVDPSGPTLHTWLDGAAVTGLEVASGAPTDADGQWLQGAAWAPHLSDARFGWESYAGEAETLWFDDIAIGPSRIGCND